MIENIMTIDSEWLCMEDEDIEPGHFNRYGQFVKEEYLLEVALEDAQNDSAMRDSFLEKVLDFVENDKEATKKFLKWVYPGYLEE